MKHPWGISKSGLTVCQACGALQVVNNVRWACQKSRWEYILHGEWNVVRYLGTRRFNLRSRGSTNLMGRFGAGWNRAIGVKWSRSSTYIELYIFSLSIDRIEIQPGRVIPSPVLNPQNLPQMENQ